MVQIIAEIGTSHENSKSKAKQLIDASVDSGADIIKFQWVFADEILHPKTGFVNLPTGNISLYERFKQLECEQSFYEEMKNYVHSKGCKFCCSPFGLKSLSLLLEIKPDFIKIASPELNHTKMLEFLAKNNKNNKIPVILSSGVSKLSDIEKALEILGTENITLLHCITSYPAPEIEYNLRLIENLSNIFGIPVGVSDHSLNPILVPTLSVLCGSQMIEKHITLSRQTKGLDDPVALEPEQFSMMTHCVKQTQTLLNHYGKSVGKEKLLSQLSEQFSIEQINQVLGNGIKKLANSEKENYGRTNRSLHYLCDLHSGDKISKENIAILRTEKTLSVGISPTYFDFLLGKTLIKNVNSGDGVQFSDFIE